MIRLRAVSWLVAAALLLGLAGCGDDGEAPEGLPAGSVKSADGLWMIPVGGPDAGGCQAYRLYSKDRMTVQVIYFRKADGSFVSGRAAAGCGMEDE